MSKTSKRGSRICFCYAKHVFSSILFGVFYLSAIKARVSAYKIKNMYPMKIDMNALLLEHLKRNDKTN